MTSINSINVKSQGVGAKTGFGNQPKPEKELEGEKGLQTAAQKSSVSADRVLDFLAANSAVAPKKTVNPAHYVDEASAQRIASFMGSFEEKVTEGLKAFEQEFAGVDIADSAKMAVVLRQINQEA